MTPAKPTASSRLKAFVLSFKNVKSRRIIATNILSLSLLQYGSYVFPLITIPYLTRTIGVEMFGLVAFAQATVAYFNTLVNYGFSYTGPRHIAINRDDKESIRKIFSQVMWTKLVLAGFGFALMVAFLAAVPKFRHEYFLFLASYTIVIGNVFTSEWFFQGIEDMKYITVAGLIGRTVSTALIFILIRGRADYVLVPLVTAAGSITGAVYGQWVIWKNYRIIIGRIDLAGIRQQLREGWDVFLSSAFISLYTTSNVFLLGLLTSNTMVGYYSAAEKTVGAIRSLWGPIPQALYPHFSKVYAQDPETGKRHLRKVLAFTGGATLLLSIAGCLAAPLLVRYYLGSAFANSTIVIQILVFTVLAIGISNVLGIHGLLANGLNTTFRNIVFVSGVLNVLLLVLLVRIWGLPGSAVSVVVVEFLIVAAQWIALRKRALV